MANQGGRPVSSLFLSAEERGYLERQIRRHRAPRSLSEHCRIILRCSEGLSNKAVAGELGFPTLWPDAIRGTIPGASVIASRYCGRAIEDKLNGILLGEPSGQAIAQAIRRCLENPNSLAQMSKRSLMHMEKFRSEAVLSQLINSVK